MTAPIRWPAHLGACLIGLACLTSAPMTWAQAPDQPPPGQAHSPEQIEHRIQQAKQRLHLTPEQEPQLRDLLKEEADKLKAIHQQYAGDTSHQATRAKREAARAVQKDFRAKLSALLTPDQMKEWDKMRSEAIARAREHRHNHAGASAP